MTIHGFYRLVVWLPLVIPAIVALLVHGLHLAPSGPLAMIVQLLLASLLYGGVPYAVVAGYATWWIGGRSEQEIRRRAWRAPFFMLGAWTVVAAIFGILARSPRLFVGLAGLGAAVIFVLGYSYVALVLLLRRLIYPALRSTAD
jgi:hypothetical protein